ncbi:MAG: choice-of-anchor P family protein, partial [Actinomycetota bacterium]
MTRRALVPACLAAALVALSVPLAAPAASSAPIVHGAVARAFGVSVHVDTPVASGAADVKPTPLAEALDPSTGEVSDTVVGPVRTPNDGSIVSDARALVASASRTVAPAPAAQAESLVTHVALLEQAGVPMIQAEVVHAVSSTKCAGDGAVTSAAGSRLAGLWVAGQAIDRTPDPNTEIPLVYDGDTPADARDDLSVRVILNEQRAASTGYGLVVTMIHVILYTPDDPLAIVGDVRIAEALSSVWCNGGGPRPNPHGIQIDKVATATSSDPFGALDDGTAFAYRGDAVTWDATITNRSTTGCTLTIVTDSLPVHFGYVSTSGPLSADGDPALERQDVVYQAGRIRLDAGQTITQQITARVSPDAPYGWYTNLFTVFESSCSEATGGLLGPVRVVPRPHVLTVQRHNGRPAGSPARQPLAATGVGAAPIAAAVAMLAAA